LAGLKLVQSIGIDAIERRIAEVTGAIKAGAMQRGWNLVSPVDPAKHGALVTLRSHKVDLLVKWLAQDNIIVSNRDDNLRISPHVYNDQSDVDRLMDALTKHRELLV
jgi:selenocysteine lyase/cysteine desulfurase